MVEASVTPAAILAFWRDAGPDRWYSRDDAFDAEVRRRFFGLWQRAAAGELSSWETSDDGALALVIVLDQFPRNLFRDDIRTYASDAQAREVAHRAIERGGVLDAAGVAGAGQQVLLHQSGKRDWSNEQAGYGVRSYRRLRR